MDRNNVNKNKNVVTIMIMGVVDSLDKKIHDRINDANHIGELLKNKGFNVIVPDKNKFFRGGFSYERVTHFVSEYNSQIKNADFVLMMNCADNLFSRNDYKFAEQNKKIVYVMNDLEYLLTQGREELTHIRRNTYGSQESVSQQYL